MIELKSPRDIDIMRTGGRLLSEIASELENMVAPGLTTIELEKKAASMFKKKKLKPAFLNYGVPPFPATICTSINDEIVHGIPSAGRTLSVGDIISIDIGCIYRKMCTDMAFTVPVGSAGEKPMKLIGVTRRALEAAIAKMYTTSQLGDVSAAVEELAAGEGYSVVRELVGHGVGRKLHEPPNVPNYGRPGTGIRLEPGIVLALEPMLCVGSGKISYGDDGWTVRTADGSLSAHFEHTVAVTSDGPIILTESV